MAEKTPSRRSPKKSSPAPSKAGSDVRPLRRKERLDEAGLIARLDRDEFPSSLYVDGPDESLKAALLGEVRHAWTRACPEAPHARVFRAGEDRIDGILAAYHGTSLFTPRELLIVLEVEAIGRSERVVESFAEGIARGAGGSCLVLVESTSETPRKSLEALRAAAAARFTAMPLSRAALIGWGQRRVTREGLTVEAGVLETLSDACENDPSEFLNELEKLLTCVGPDRRLTRAEASALLRPVADSDLADFLAAVAVGHAGLASRRLGRLLAAGEGEGSVLFALVQLVGGALGGWTRWREPSLVLARRRRAPGELARALDALYRAEAAWKGGRADAVVVLEQVTREICGPTPVTTPA
jgi:DNA polymerase III delta subunit